jgi:hypothetical protein
MKNILESLIELVESAEKVRVHDYGIHDLNKRDAKDELNFIIEKLRSGDDILIRIHHDKDRKISGVSFNGIEFYGKQIPVKK